MLFNPRNVTLAISPALALLFGGPVSGQTYTVQNAGSNVWLYSESHGINGVGNVVGEYEPTNFIYVLAFLNQAGVITDLGHLGGTPYAIAHGINDANQVVGESDSGNNTRAFLWSNGTMTDLGTLGGNNITGYSSAHAINRAGEVVGESSLSFIQASTVHAVLYNGSTKTDLGVLSGDYSSAQALNNSGVIVGESSVVIAGQTNIHAFVYTNKTMTDLGTLGGGYSSAKGINDMGVIVGEAEAVSGGVTNLHAFVYRNGSMTDLGTFGGTSSSASAINSAGEIVGYAIDTNGVSNAFLYQSGKMVNLNDLIPSGSGWTNLSSADAINDAGQIAGSGLMADGSYEAYLLTLAAPLTVTITNPAANAVFGAPASFVVAAMTVDTAGTVTNVQFQMNGNVIGNATTAPYTASVNNLNAGTYTLTAIASDKTELRATNTISVTVTDAPPVVTVTNPAPNAIFQAPATFSVSASASDPDGTITNVQFQVNGAVIGNATLAPYTATANSLGAGTYSLAAIAFDNAGLKSTNSISITVTNGSLATVSIANPGSTQSGFSFSFATQTGYNYQGQFNTNLEAANGWLVFTNLSGNGSVVTIVDPSPTNMLRFYRVVAF